MIVSWQLCGVCISNCTHYECKLCAFHFRHLHHLFIYEKFTRTESANEPKNGNAPCELWSDNSKICTYAECGCVCVCVNHILGDLLRKFDLIEFVNQKHDQNIGDGNCDGNSSASVAGRHYEKKNKKKEIQFNYTARAGSTWITYTMCIAHTVQSNKLPFTEYMLFKATNFLRSNIRFDWFFN